MVVSLRTLIEPLECVVLINAHADAPHEARPEVVLCLSMALQRSLIVPLHGELCVPRNSDTVLVAYGEVVLSFGVALRRGGDVPLAGQALTLAHADALLVEDAQIALGFGVPCLGAASVPYDRSLHVLLHSDPVLMAECKVELRHWQLALVGAGEEQPECLFLVLLHTPSVFVAHAEVVHGFVASLFRRIPVAGGGLFHVRFRPDSLRVADPQVELGQSVLLLCTLRKPFERHILVLLHSGPPLVAKRQVVLCLRVTLHSTRGVPLDCKPVILLLTDAFRVAVRKVVLGLCVALLGIRFVELVGDAAGLVVHDGVQELRVPDLLLAILELLLAGFPGVLVEFRACKRGGIEFEFEASTLPSRSVLDYLQELLHRWPVRCKSADRQGQCLCKRANFLALPQSVLF
mmetsp:Transcript_40004/g.77846  ORF Transcript_40004/g.77846 Transcript_40004/m.77846 type:complete len:404 (-) Transcript_40004:1071-2282(-)